MSTERERKYNEDAMTSPIVEQNKVKCPSCAEDIMTNPDAEEKKRQSPSSGEDIMAVTGTPHENLNKSTDDIMNSPLIEENKTKYGKDIMVNPDIEEKKDLTPSSRQDIMSANRPD